MGRFICTISDLTVSHRSLRIAEPTVASPDSNGLRSDRGEYGQGRVPDVECAFYENQSGEG